MVYNGTAAATFTLPAAQAGTTSFKGRVYQIKNNAAQTLVIAAAGTELISGEPVILLAAGSVAELISTGATTGSTWEVLSSSKPVYGTDALRGALASTGCASCAAYDAAATNTWVAVDAADYTALQALDGAAVYGVSSLTGTANGTINSSITYTQNVVNQGPVPANAYPFALALRSASSVATMMAGVKLKLSTSAQTAGYADWPVPGAALPTSTTQINTIYYVLKRPSAAVAAAAYLAIYTASFSCSLYTSQGGTSYASVGDSATPATARPGNTPVFQVLATPTKQW